MLIAHLSDLHLRDAADAVWLDRQLDRVASRAPDHLAITGDLLDRWRPRLLARALDALHAHGLLQPERLTLLTGNHDLASSGGHPRRRADLWRLVGRFWDPPPIIAARRRRFHRIVARRAAGISAPAPWSKTLRNGATIAVIDTVPAFWIPASLSGHTLVVRHAVGSIGRAQASWLAGLRSAPRPLIVLMHHYPLAAPPFSWMPQRALGWLRAVAVRMEIAEGDRYRFWEAAASAEARLILCGHLHRARLENRNGIAIGLNGQSGAAWAGRTIAWYQIGENDVRMEMERTADAEM